MSGFLRDKVAIIVAKRKNRSRRMRRNEQSRVGMLMITIVVVFFSLVMMYQMRVLRAQDNRYAAQVVSLQRQIEEEESRATELEEAKTYVQTRQYVEQMAREKLGLVNPDEKVVKARE